MKTTNSLGKIMAVAISFLLINPVSAQEKQFDINDYQWLVGHWVGDGFGGVSEEMWAPAVDGVMMGMYRNVQNGKVSFYEFINLSKEGMRLKHFKSDLVAWEDKEEMVKFELLDYDDNTLVFDALKITRIDNDNMKMELKLKQNGTVSTEVFKFSRKK
ncbi:DUF6265 family protein [Fulvivirga lutimaris]|uniref:DUF6265 family protein n=1 Tax=Fulvivirga lutimaris TaxID=1819566 RepID=UPI0012BBB8CE|nr:DUF6265 family protein [Fulvivirga lutimaris]MTI41249.1 hypothetical protein [Fulvivirga lutimaris]